ncbi:hypothetical protein TNCV_1664001 [Trichonephila clavipes]|uniref:Uncharacterized protein n=1 Tax=Trichonephila clavipes TaxID=2585209 RepID=A0A8X6RUB3_TRICX|nr:hypothetical protein TNCV_1664001 [Trichonephila clavipes]
MHIALFVKRFLVDKLIHGLEDPPYCPNITSYDLYLFRKVNIVLMGTHFQSVEAVKAKTTDLLKMVTPNEPQHCFER